ncbi:protein FAM221B-like [Lytechinus variegatus]|uniref:protein FAM221B-like n=1 Tax=Lytechinus variegatus TaxID=7654 RepID=UPI001BB123D8|nr:protein FAM221B-like [Lytechinus variegatus]
MSSGRAPSQSGVGSKAPPSPNRSPRQGSSPRYHGNKDLSPRISLEMRTGAQTPLSRSHSPQIYGRVTPLSLDRGSPSSGQLERGPSGLEGKSNKARLPPVSPSTKKKSSSKQVSPRQKTETKALVPKSAGTLASLKAAKEALPIVKKDGMYFPKGYTLRPIIPAQKAELIDVARAMNREDFGPRVKKLFDPETVAATEAIKSGVYIGWRCPEFTWDCIRVGRLSRCFCGHLLQEHASYNGHSVRVPCKQGGCHCKAFAFIPGRPEDIGEFWFQRRRNFDPTTWRAKCKCKHTHEQHDVTGLRRCKVGGCGCGAFHSNFLCAACDRHWEDHETVFETETERMKKNIPCGQDYLPFAEMPNMRNMALTGVDNDPGIYTDLVEGEGAIPRSNRAITQDTPFMPPSGSGFNPVWD